MKLGRRGERFWCNIFRDRLPVAIAHSNSVNNWLNEDARRQEAVDEATKYADAAVEALRQRQGLPDPIA